MTQPMSTRAVVDALLDRIATGDPAKVAELYADQVDWKLGWPEDEHGAACRGSGIVRLAPTPRITTAPSAPTP